MRYFGLAMAAILVAAPAAAQNVKAGVDAWGKGDFRGAVDQWRGPAVAGDADAQFNLAQAYKLGRGVPVDPAMAESWFRKAALQGHLQAEDNYGLALFQSGKKADAVPWLEKSVARGESRAQLVLGTMLFNGDGVPRDYPRAYALMTLASQKGLKSASETLAQMDQYVSATDREKGVALARQYAQQPRPAPVSMPRPPRDVATRPAPRPTAPARAPRPDPVAVVVRPAPARAPAAAPVAPVARKGAWRIQLGAFRDQGNAEALWNRVRGKLGGAQPAYVKGGGVTRLQATGFASRADAQRACSASGVTCVVVAP